MCSEASNLEPYDLHTVGFGHHCDPKLSVLSECMWGTDKTTQHHCGMKLSVLSECMWGTDSTTPLWHEVVCVV